MTSLLPVLIEASLAAGAEIERIKRFYGVREQRLEQLLDAHGER